MEAGFTDTAYQEAMGLSDSGMMHIADGVAHITREPIDTLKQVVSPELGVYPRMVRSHRYQHHTKRPAFRQ